MFSAFWRGLASKVCSLTLRLASESGNLTNGCASAGAHYNPFNKTHGAPTDIERHVGDLGNIQTNDAGEAVLEFEDSIISLNGPFSIIGWVRSLQIPTLVRMPTPHNLWQASRCTPHRN